MNGILGPTPEVMLDDNPSPDHRTNLELPKFSSDPLLSIINDILDLSKVEAGQNRARAHLLLLREQIDELLKLADVRAQDRNIRLRSSIGYHVPNELVGDPSPPATDPHEPRGQRDRLSENADVVLTVTLGDPQESRLEVNSASRILASET